MWYATFLIVFFWFAPLCYALDCYQHRPEQSAVVGPDSEFALPVGPERMCGKVVGPEAIYALPYGPQRVCARPVGPFPEFALPVPTERICQLPVAPHCDFALPVMPDRTFVVWKAGKRTIKCHPGSPLSPCREKTP